MAGARLGQMAACSRAAAASVERIIRLALAGGPEGSPDCHGFSRAAQGASSGRGLGACTGRRTGVCRNAHREKQNKRAFYALTGRLVCASLHQNYYRFAPNFASRKS